MTTLERLLRSLRRAPEPLKRRLRPALVRSVDAVRATPGGATGIALLRRLAPGMHGWLRRRYSFYTDGGAALTVMLPTGPEETSLDADALIALGWVRRSGSDRVN